jgi:uncharacterized DUF497 family protein
MAIIFEWDSPKALANRRKHGVSFEQALSVFRDPLARSMPDVVHSDLEMRQVILGESGSPRRLLVVVFVERGDRYRIISARLATKRERLDYEED